MLNKIYKKILFFMRENFRIILVYLAILFVILCPVNYYIIAGGGVMDAEKRVVVSDSYKSRGSFSFCYVKELRGTILTYLSSFIMGYERESVESVKVSKSDTKSDIRLRDRILMNNATNNAIYNAYSLAGASIKVKNKYNYVYYITESAKTNLKLGDNIVKIDDVEIDGIDDMKRYVKEKNIDDKVSILVKNNGKTVEKYAYVYQDSGEKFIGVSVISDKEYDTEPEVSVNFKSRESGPSGGLVLALIIYNKLVKSDITHGYDIAGTGTMEEDGSVGEIDGVKYKLKGAEESGKDIFLVPDGRNYKEAIKEKEKNNYKIKVIGVKSLEDAVEVLKKIKK